MSGLLTSGGLAEYRGRMYLTYSGGTDYLGLVIPSDQDAPNFPDGIKFGKTNGLRWVDVPRTSLTRRLFRQVNGLWHGAEVSVGKIYTSGWDEGKVNLAYEGSSPEEALALGFRGDQYMGWYVAADPAEVEVTDVTITERPLETDS